MVSAVKGVLITWCAGLNAAAPRCARAARGAMPRVPTPPPTPPSDAPTKELILALNAARPTGDRFVLDDLDDTHVLVDPAAVDAIAARVAALADELSFAPPPRAPHE
jgi:hypothetical protein